MVQIKKTYLILITLLSLTFTLGVGYIIGNSVNSEAECDLPQNVKIDVKAILQEIKILEVIQKDSMLDITFSVTINDSIKELIDEKIICTIYDAPVSAEVINRVGNVVALTPTVSKYQFDFSDNTTFTISFNLDSVAYKEIFNDAQSVNVSFMLDETSSNTHEYITTYVF